MRIEPHVCFDGRCEEALEFYRETLGAEVTFIVRFKEMPGPHPPGSIPPGGENKIMHASFRVGETTILASDGHCKGAAKFERIQLAVQGVDTTAAQKLFDALVDGGTVLMPMTKTFWSPLFGMVTDRFGVQWMINGQA
jgi:PhnB protein